jgi:hypothetical protein
MNRCRVILLAVVVSLLAMPALAQEKKPESVARVFVMVPKAGMTQQFEEGRKKHMDFHKKSGDTWTWETWSVATGEGTGNYVSVAGGHTWKDLDAWDAKLEATDTADGDKNMTPFLAASLGSVWAMMPDVSKPRAGMTPPKMQEVIHFQLKQGGEENFNYAIKKISEAINKTNWPVNYTWFALVNGGNQPHYVLIIPRDNWASMAEPDVSFDAMIEKAFGRHEAEVVTKSIDNSVARQWSEMLTFRPELSYMPAGK